MKRRSNLPLGSYGEAIAAKFLKSKGYRVLEKNFKKRYGEIDIVALDGKTLVFVEVKTRIGRRFGTPAESITPWKVQSLIRSAQYYKLLHEDLPSSMRIDVVGIELTSEEDVEKIELYKNITG